MTIQAKATFEIESWNENAYDEEGPKLTKAVVKKSFRGDIEGEGRLEYLMMYRNDGSADFIGLERVVGRIGNRRGSFVLQHTGAFEGGTAKAKLVVVTGSGTDQLKRLRGEGRLAATHAQQYEMSLDYDFE